MPNSDANITRTQLIARAFRRIGIRNPSTNDAADAVLLLNIIVKEIDEEGRWLWAISNTENTITLSSGTRTYSTGSGAANIKTDILELENFELLIGTSYRPLRIIGKTESLEAYEREGTGEPILVHLTDAPLLASRTLIVLPTPSGTYTGKYTYRRRLYDFDNASDNPDFPSSWGLRLIKRLAKELAPEYGIPLQERQILEAESQMAMKEGKAAAADKAPPTRQRAEYF